MWLLFVGIGRFSMQTKDKVSKAAWALFEGAKDSVVKNVIRAAQAKQLKIDDDVLPLLLTVVTTSLDEGFHKGHYVFTRTVEDDIKQEIRDLAKPAAPVAAPVPAKKK